MPCDHDTFQNISLNACDFNDIFSEIEEARADRSRARSNEEFDFFATSWKHTYVPKFARQR